MKIRTTSFVVMFVACILAVSYAFAQEPPPVTNDGSGSNLISIMLDDVELADIVRMFTRISGANIIVNPEILHGRATLNILDKPWKPTLEAVLSEHGLILTEKVPGSGTYVITAKEDKELDELTGILKRTVKAFSPYSIQLDGDANIFYLRGDVLRNVLEGKRIRVRGMIKTEIINPAGDKESSTPDPKQQPKHWHIYMDVKESSETSAPFEKPQP